MPRILSLMVVGDDALVASIRSIEDTCITFVIDKLWNLDDYNDALMLDLYLKLPLIEEGTGTSNDLVLIVDSIVELVNIIESAGWFSWWRRRTIEPTPRAKALCRLASHIRDRSVDLHGKAPLIEICVTVPSDGYDEEVLAVLRASANDGINFIRGGDITPIREGISRIKSCH